MAGRQAVGRVRVLFDGGAFCGGFVVSARAKQAKAKKSLDWLLGLKEGRDVERAAVVAWLLKCSEEANRQRLNMLQGGHRIIAKRVEAESEAYRNAVAMIERGDHLTALPIETPGMTAAERGRG